MRSTETDRGWSARDRRATGAVAVQFAINGAFFASVMPRLPELRDGLRISTTAIGVVLTVASASGLAASATCSRVIARFGTRRVLFAGGLAISAALVVVGVASSWPLAVVALAVMFAFDVYVDVAMNMQGSWLSARRSHPIINRLHALWSLGSVAGGVVAAQLAAARVSLAVHLAAVAVVLAVLSCLVATQLLPVDGAPTVEDATSPTGDAPGRDGVSRRGAWVRFFVGGMTAIVVEIAAINWAAFRMSDDLGRSASSAALAYVAVMGGMTLTRLGGDHLAHWLGPSRFTTASAVVAVGALGVAGIVAVPVVVVVAFGVAGLGAATLTPRLYDLAARAGGGTARGLGVLTAGMRVATIVTPAAIATLAAWSTVGVAIALVGGLAGLVFIAATRPREAVRS